MTNRRDFLKTASLLLAGGYAGSHLLTGCAGNSGPGKSIGLQLYSLRDAMKEDVPGTLKKVAEMGYTTLETASYNDGKVYGMSPAEFKKLCNDLGMKIKSAHVGGEMYKKENETAFMDFWKKAIDTHAELGVNYLVQPFMPVNDQTTLEELKVQCDYYNSLGYMTAAAGGIGFGYHNHNFEFRKIGEETIYDFMLKNTSPNHVFFQMDVYWVVEGGADPVNYMQQYPDRFPVLHIKDEKEIGASGKMNFEPIFAMAYQNGMKDYFVEVEKYDYDPVESVKMSYDFLNKASYVK